MFINITAAETGNNKGSSSALVQYLEKENKGRDSKDHELWFNVNGTSIHPFEVRIAIDGNVAKLGRDEAKFFLINLSPSKKELYHLSALYGEEGVKHMLKSFAESMMDEYARNFKRKGIDSGKDLLWFAKVENDRYYKHNDKAVRDGTRKVGDKKEGMQMHVQIIVSRKDFTNQIKLSPQNTSKGSNAEHSAKLGQFDRRAFKESGERVFDSMFGFHRNLKDTVGYAATMKNGSIQDKLDMYALTEESEHSETENRTVAQSAGEEVKVQDTVAFAQKEKQQGTAGLFDIRLNLPADSTSPEEEKRKRRLRKR